MRDWQQGIIESTTGARLNFYLAPHKTRRAKPKAVIQINHGMSEHAGRYQEFAQYLAKRGYTAIAQDHRGHGETTAPDAPTGSFGGNDGGAKLLQDIDAVNRHITELYPDIPIVCFGHSLGAIFAMNYVVVYPQNIAAAAIWNANIKANIALHLFRLILKTERMLKGSDVPSAMAPQLTFEPWRKKFQPGRTQSDWLSCDEEEVDKYISDPLCGFPLSVGAWLSVTEAIAKGASKSAIEALPKTMPFNLVAGDDDPASENGQSICRLGQRLRSSGMTDVSVRIYPHTRHECLHEINRDQVMTDFTDWLDERFG
ncbi:MAG: alpha/beta hydrolase [Pseudomonadota bacterium]